MRLSPVQRRNEKRRGKAGLSLAKRTGAGGAEEIVVEIEAGKAARSVFSELFGRCRELACDSGRHRARQSWDNHSL
jgi:hypothetical protein